MKQQTLRGIASQLIAGANMATIALMAISGYSSHLNPVDHAWLANAGLLLPLFIAVNLAFIPVWVMLRPRYVLIPVAGFLICYSPVNTYSPINVESSAPSEGDVIKVLSYNVYGYYGTAQGSDSIPILNYIARCDADIVCIQEATTDSRQDYVDSVLNSLYPYHAVLRTNKASTSVAVYTRCKIIDDERINYESEGNMSMACRLLYKGDTILVVNNHLESNHLTAEDKEQFNSIVKRETKGDTARQEARSLLAKLANASRKRAPQVDAVARYIADNQADGGVILCGDFNENPIGYANHILRSRAKLTDCYVAAGRGPGWSYHKSNIHVRIDNIFCSKQWTPYACKVDKSIADSDHYPIYCWLKRKDNN